MDYLCNHVPVDIKLAVFAVEDDLIPGNKKLIKITVRDVNIPTFLIVFPIIYIPQKHETDKYDTIQPYGKIFYAPRDLSTKGTVTINTILS